MAEQINNKIKGTTDYLQERIGKPELGIILGTGLGGLTEKIAKEFALPYSMIPHFPASTVEGHEGMLIAGGIGEKNILVMHGRFHYYEGYSLQEITFPIRVMTELGIKNLVITNAAGGINPKFAPGDLMLINDHINFSGINPLRGPNVLSQGVRFPDMTEAYNPRLKTVARETAIALNIKIQEGVYGWVTGPSYETPAEIKAFSLLGADAIGMSTVPEVIVANHCGLNVLGISYITNTAAGIKPGRLSHNSVIDTAKAGKEKFQNFIIKVVDLV